MFVCVCLSLPKRGIQCLSHGSHVFPHLKKKIWWHSSDTIHYKILTTEWQYIQDFKVWHVECHQFLFAMTITLIIQQCSTRIVQMWTSRRQKGEQDDAWNTMQKAPAAIPQLKPRGKRQSYAQKKMLERNKKQSDLCSNQLKPHRHHHAVKDVSRTGNGTCSKLMTESYRQTHTLLSRAPSVTWCSPSGRNRSHTM